MSKPIVCPECITLYEKSIIQKNKETDELLDETEENVDQDTGEILNTEPVKVEVFSDWKDYAKHIMVAHPSSSRVNWVLSSANDEIERCKQQKRALSPVIYEIIELSKDIINIEQSPVIDELSDGVDEDHDRAVLSFQEKLNKAYGIKPEVPEEEPTVKSVPVKSSTNRILYLIGGVVLALGGSVAFFMTKIPLLGIAFLVAAVILLFVMMRKPKTKKKARATSV